MVSILRTVSNLCLGLAGAVFLTATAFAQPAELAVPANKDWQHDWTPMTFPARIGDFERDRISQIEERQTNVAGQYTDRENGTFLTLYIYRPGNASTAIWFDRALVAIGIAETYGTVDLDEMKIGTFVPNGGTAQSGQFAVLEVDGNIRSTGVALYRTGEWLVKLRISSPQMSVTQMDELLRETLTELPELTALDNGSAKFISACEDTLQFAETRPIESDLGAVALGQAIAVTAEQNVANGNFDDQAIEELSIEDRGGLNYCRQGDRNYEYNVYRPVGTDDRYTVAIRDAGFSIEVYPDLVATELNNDGSGDTAFTVRSATGLEIVLHTPFLGLPNLGPASQSALNGPVIAKVNRPLADDEDPTITLSVGQE